MSAHCWPGNLHVLECQCAGSLCTNAPIRSSKSAQVSLLQKEGSSRLTMTCATYLQFTPPPPFILLRATLRRKCTENAGAKPASTPDCHVREGGTGDLCGHTPQLQREDERLHPEGTVQVMFCRHVGKKKKHFELFFDPWALRGLKFTYNLIFHHLEELSNKIFSRPSSVESTDHKAHLEFWLLLEYIFKFLDKVAISIYMKSHFSPCHLNQGAKTFLCHFCCRVVTLAYPL